MLFYLINKKKKCLLNETIFTFQFLSYNIYKLVPLLKLNNSNNLLFFI